MITKETARQIYNCHQQIEEIGKIKSDMCEEVEKRVNVRRKTRAPLLKMKQVSANMERECNWVFLTVYVHQCAFQHFARNCHSGDG